jgi:hypothetical protein
MSDPCAICFEAITAETGHATMACAHTFHFRCLSSWFVEQLDKELKETCPCCRREGGEKETFAPDAEGDEDDDDSEYDEEDEEDEDYYCLIRAELDATLKQLGGTGCSLAMWRHVFPGEPEEFREDCAMTFSRAEIENFAAVQGGGPFTEEQWAAFLAQFGEAAEAPAAAAEPAAAPVVPPLQLNISWVLRPNGTWARVVQEAPAAAAAVPVWGAASPEQPPDDLVVQTVAAAKKLQALWRGYRVRRASASA